MASDQTEELQKIDEEANENKRRIERENWVVNSPDPPGTFQDLFSSVKEVVFPHRKSSSKEMKPGKFAVSFLHGLFPIFSWARNYRLSMFKNDFLAGLTLASLSIPQSIGYANLAKLDPQYGLYTSVVPPLIYSVMGSSRDLAIGPVAVVSLLLSSMVQNLQDPATNPVSYRNLVFTVTFFAGIFQALFGIFRLGFLIDFLSHAALVGFMGGAAIVIGLQQLKGLLGINHFTTKTDIISVLHSVFTSIDRL